MALLGPSAWRWGIRAAVSAAVVTILLRVIPVRSVVDALVRISLWTWISSLCIFFAGHYLNAVKLRLLIGAKRVPLAPCIRAQYAGLVANLGLPGLAGGDLVRAAYLARTAGARQVALASVADRLIDTSTIIVLIAIALPVAGVPPAIAGVVRAAGWWIFGAAGVVAALGVVVIYFRKHRAIAGKLAQVSTGLQSRRLAVVGAAAISLVVQSAFVMTNVWLARQVGVTTGLSAWFVAWPLSKLIAVLPISLGGIGVREAALVSLLAPYGAPREAVLASGILWQAVLIVTGLAGLVLTQLIPGSSASTAPIEASSKRA